MTDVSRDSIVVVCAADDGYAMPLAVMVRSIFANLKSDCKVALYVIDGGIRYVNKRKILKSINLEQCQIEWLQPSDVLIGKVKMSHHVTIAAYYRLLIPDLLPHRLKKAIYLDSDLILNEDLGKLWNIDIKENYLLAAQSIETPYVSSLGGLKTYKELDIPPSSKYFNSGVLVINLEKWRTDSISTKVIEYLEQNREQVQWWDQDGLNAILVGKWGELDPRWNQTPSIHDYSSWKDSPFKEKVYQELIGNPYIIHFATSSKPWNSRHEHPAKNLFFQYLDMTAWSGWRFTIWRRFWRRLSRETKQFKSFVSALKD